MNLNYKKCSKSEGCHKNPLKLNHGISKWKKWKCCQPQRLILVSESRSDTPLGSAPPLSVCCCDLFLAAFSICLSDKRLTRSLPVSAERAAKPKLAVDPADLQATLSRKWNLYPAICLNFWKWNYPHSDILHLHINTVTPLLFCQRPISNTHSWKYQGGLHVWMQTAGTQTLGFRQTFPHKLQMQYLRIVFHSQQSSEWSKSVRINWTLRLSSFSFTYQPCILILETRGRFRHRWINGLQRWGWVSNRFLGPLAPNTVFHVSFAPDCQLHYLPPPLLHLHPLPALSFLFNLSLVTCCLVQVTAEWEETWWSKGLQHNNLMVVQWFLPMCHLVQLLDIKWLHISEKPVHWYVGIMDANSKILAKIQNQSDAEKTL